MGRPKGTKNKVVVESPDEEIVAEASAALVVEEPKISLLTQDFGREDINTLRDKINEIIKSR